MRRVGARCAFALATALLGAAPATIVQPQPSGVPWTSDAIAKLGGELDAMLANDPALRGAHYGVYAVDTATGAQLYAHAPDDEVQPASTLKLLVGSAALEKLGPTMRYRTQLLLTTQAPMPGRPDSNTFNAVVLRAGGDPFLNTADFRTAAAALAARSKHDLHAITIDDSRYETQPYPVGWTWDDFAQSYAPHVSALAFEENVANVTVTPGRGVASPAQIRAPFAVTRTPIEGCVGNRNHIQIIPLATTGTATSEDTIDVRIGETGCLQIFGSIPLGASPEDIGAAVDDPIVYAQSALQRLIYETGINDTALIAFIGPVDAWARASEWQRKATDLVWSHDSAPLATWLGPRFWIPSDNLVGEMLLRELGYATGGAPGTTDNGIAYEKTWLQSIGVDPATVTLADGCGMSQYDRITARDLVTILQHDWNGPNRQLVLDSLPVGGARGTIEGIAGTDAAGRVFAKTGSMMHVRGLAGYLAPLHHGAVTFAFEVDDWNGAYPDLAALRARFLSRIVSDAAT